MLSAELMKKNSINRLFLSVDSVNRNKRWFQVPARMPIRWRWTRMCNETMALRSPMDLDPLHRLKTSPSPLLRIRCVFWYPTVALLP